MNARGLQPASTTDVPPPQPLPLSETVEAAQASTSLRGKTSPLLTTGVGGRAVRGATLLVVVALILVVAVSIKLRGAVITA